MNKVILFGYVGKDPDITSFQNGGKVAQFSLATTEKGYKTKDGREIPDETQWHNIVVRKSGLAGVCESYVRKGTPLLIEGKLKTRTYNANDGSMRYVTEVVVDELTIMGKRENPSVPAQAPAPNPMDSDDDLPFSAM